MAEDHDRSLLHWWRTKPVGDVRAACLAPRVTRSARPRLQAVGCRAPEATLCVPPLVASPAGSLMLMESCALLWLAAWLDAWILVVMRPACAVRRRVSSRSFRPLLPCSIPCPPSQPRSSPGAVLLRPISSCSGRHMHTVRQHTPIHGIGTVQLELPRMYLGIIGKRGPDQGGAVLNVSDPDSFT